MQTERQPPPVLTESAVASDRRAFRTGTEAHFKTSASEFQLLLDRQQEWRARLEMIENAREVLYISTYYIEYDDYAIAFLEALQHAIDRGVRVYLISDGFGQVLSSNLMTPAGKKKLRMLLDALRARGATIVSYRPPRFLQRMLGTGYHIKYQVSEQGEMLFSSSNISQMSFDRWMEFSVRLKGPVVSLMLEDLFRILPMPHLADLAKLALSSNTPFTNGHASYLFDFITYIPGTDPSPLSPIIQRHKNPLTTALIEHIETAKSSLVLSSFYFKPHPRLFAAIDRAAARGVRVEIHHSHRDALGGVTRLPWLAASARYPAMLSPNGRIAIYEHLLGQHTKFVLIDDRVAWLGSYNFEHAADDRLAEAMLITTDRRVVVEVQRFFAQLRRDRHNVPVRKAEFAALPRMLRFYRWLCLPVKRWL